MGEEVRAFDWSTTSLGPQELWPRSLKTVVGLVLHATSPMVLAFGPELRLIHNDAYLPFIRPASGSGIGRSLPEFRPDIWPVIKPYIRSALRGVGTGARDVEMITHRNGLPESANFTFSYSPVFNDQDLPEGVLAYLQETTSENAARQALEAENDRFRRLFDQAPVVLGVTSADDFRFEYVNCALERMIGRSLVGRQAQEAIPELVPHGFLGFLEDVRRTGRPYVGHDHPLVLETPAGNEQHFIDFIYQPIVDSGGRVTGILCLGIDVTERHRALNAERQLQKQLLSASRLNGMGLMAATMAHELNQPLAAATNYLNGLRALAGSVQGDAAESFETGLDGVKEQIRRASQIVKRVRAGLDSEPEQNSVSLRRIIEDALATCQGSCFCSAGRIECDLPDDLPPVRADAIQTEQVMANLIRNACEAMQGAPRRVLRISARKGGEFVVVRVEDSGPGLDCDPFSRFGVSPKGGMGVGLAISRTIVEGQGGRIWAEQVQGGGAAFLFTVPIS